MLTDQAAIDGTLHAHGGEEVYLRVQENGAELGIVLMAAPSPGALQMALRLGFSSALVYEAGLAISVDGRYLLLSTWLPGVRGWPGAQDALAQLLDQCAAWRGHLLPPAPSRWPASAPFNLAATRQRDRLFDLMRHHQS